MNPLVNAGSYITLDSMVLFFPLYMIYERMLRK